MAATGLWSKPASPAAATKKAPARSSASARSGTQTAKATQSAKAKASATKSSAVKTSNSSRKSPSKYNSLQARSKSSRSTTVNRYSPPSAPGSDRVREIQQALYDRGYLSVQPDGVWNASSVEALKRFESENKWKIDGKIDSRALIALGLGPKYDDNLNLPVPGSSGVVVADDAKNDLQRLN